MPDCVEMVNQCITVHVRDVLSYAHLPQRDVALLEVADDGVADVLTLVTVHRQHGRQAPLQFITEDRKQRRKAIAIPVACLHILQRHLANISIYCTYPAHLPENDEHCAINRHLAVVQIPP